MAQILSPEHVQFLMDNGLRRILRPDPDLLHQIVVTTGSNNHLIAISCNCKRCPTGSYEPIEVRSCWQPGEAAAVWREHAEAAEAVSGS